MKASVSILTLAAMLTGCTTAQTGGTSAATPSTPAALVQAPPTSADADAFVASAEKELAAFSVINNRASWVNITYITDDTDALAAYFGTIDTEMQIRLAKEAARFNDVAGLSYDTKRKLDFLRQGLLLPAPSTPGAAAELNAIAIRLQAIYSKAKGTLAGAPLSGNDLEAKMRTVRDPEQLKEMWTSWHDNAGTPMRADYARQIEIVNQGARELGYADMGAMLRSRYNMSSNDFAALTDKLWDQVKPLYDALHCYTRAGLNRKYGDKVQPASGPIRADLLGNMWAQQWAEVYDIIAPKGAGDIGYDLTDLLTSKGYDPVKMVKAGEGFYSSLGFAPLPETFWVRSQFTAPRDRVVACPASAWNPDNAEDLRIKMCIKVNANDFQVIHHELGHNYYQRAYNKQPFLYLGGANDGFHEAIGDFIALSITPEYLAQIGLLDKNKLPSADKDIGLLLRKALDRVAFLPFGLLVDKWRWGVFDGSIKPENYNQAWDDLRLQYQGIVPPVVRSEAGFDPGAKIHVAVNAAYVRYFIASILQFQFYKAACDQAGWQGPLHRCSFYGDKEVGRRLNAMLEMGASRPWPEALEAFTGTREISGEALLEYFRPLQLWLEEQNKGRQCGWQS